MGEVCMIPAGIRCCLGQRMVLLRPHPEHVVGRYLLYALQSPVVQREILVNEGTGATVSNLRIPILSSLKIPAPSLSEQRAIAAVLGALDDKIELNLKMSAALEAVARALFKSWFVDFDPVRAKAEGRHPGLPPEIAALFPNLFEDSELGQIPAGWHYSTVADVADCIKGTSYRSAELQASKAALVTLKSFERGGGYREGGLKPYVGRFKDTQVVRPGELVVAMTDVTQAAEVIGRPALVLPNDTFTALIASLDVLIVRPRKVARVVPVSFLYNLFRADRFVDHTYAHVTGTTVLHLSKNAVPSYSFALPPESVLDAFERITGPIFSRIAIASRESRSLGDVRDALLPKLISGEIRVRDAENLMERSA